jgi:hypothetical protein
VNPTVPPSGPGLTLARYATVRSVVAGFAEDMSAVDVAARCGAGGTGAVTVITADWPLPASWRLSPL